MTDPVVQIIDEASGEIVYTIRIKGTSFRPKVFKDGLYTIKLSEPDTGQTRTLASVESLAPAEQRTIGVDFQKDGPP